MYDQLIETFIIVCVTGSFSKAARQLYLSTAAIQKQDKGHRIAAFFSRASMEYYLNVMYSYLYVLDYDKHIKETID